MLCVVVGGSLFFMQQFSNELGKYSLEKVAQTSKITGSYIYWISGDAGSAYSLGDFSPTIGGMLSKFPLAVNVTLFRPYLWEAKKIIVLLSALEAILFLFVTLKILIYSPDNEDLESYKPRSYDPVLSYFFFDFCICRGNFIIQFRSFVAV